MTMGIIESDIRSYFSHITFLKGFEYFKKGRVTKALFESHIYDSDNSKTILQISGMVQSGNSSTNLTKIYSQDIHIIKYKSKKVIFLADCSCPVESDCKHIVATLISYARKDTSSKKGFEINLATRVIDDWLDGISLEEVKPTIVNKPIKVLQNNFRLQYRLDINTDNMITSVYATKSKPLKKGGYSKPASLSLEFLIRKNNEQLPKFIKIYDMEILSLLSRMNKIYYGGYTTNQFNLNGPLGGLLIKKMLNTELFFLGDSDKILTEGAPKPVTIDWKNIDNEYKLSAFIDNDSVFIHTEPPYYIDKVNYTIGIVTNFNLNNDLYHQLIELSPMIPEDIIEDVSETILKKLPSIPPLVPKKMKHNKVYSKPIPHLILSTNHIQMFFNYEDNLIKISSQGQTISKKVKDEVVTIFRNADEELNLTERLLNFGFINLHSRDIFFSNPDLSVSSAIENWRIFTDETIPTLENEGWTFEIQDDFYFEFQDIEDIQVSINEKNNWFEIEMSVEINDKKMSLLPMVTEFLTQVEDMHNLDDKINLPIGNGKFARISSEVMKPIIKTIIELYDGKEADDDGIIKLQAFEAHTIDFLDNTENMIVQGADRLIKLSKNLKNFKGLRNIKPPKGLTTELRDYQKVGLNWLDFLREFGFSGILADDMGLGKTIQTLTFMQKEKEAKRLKKPTLIVMPTSLLGNWRREAEKFTPDLKVLILHGDKRKTYFKSLNKYDLVLTTYGLIARDFEQLLKIDFYYLILDEAQKIKNPKAKVSQHLRQLKADNRLALTGTPMENHLGELWSIFTFLMPGFLGKAEHFNKKFRKPIEKEFDKDMQNILKKRIEPFMLRRKKDEVVKELPKKTVIVQTITFEKKQAQLYETIRITMEKRVRDMISEKGLASSQITILDALLKLRQVCCDPSILKLDNSKNIKESAKLEFLLNLVEELVAEGRKILLFSQFTTMLSIIEERIINMNISYSKLTGSTRDRDSVIEKFKSGKADIFLISLKAGGVGLNLTEADTVIHYDPWWNPAVEEQATDRAYRIGQDKPVFVYKLIAEKTVEEKILELQDKKRALANIMIDNSKEKFELTQDDINNLFAPIH